MPSPFPGMDPYLETMDLWPDVHHQLISEIHGLLNQRLRPHYVARITLRTYVSDQDDPGRDAENADYYRSVGTNNQQSSASIIPEPLKISLLLDDEIEEARLEIRHLESASLATVIEILNPANKIRGARGRTSFMEKRREVMDSEVHWVEIDLLRAGDPSVLRPSLRRSDYRVLVSRADRRSKGMYWPVSVRQALPVIGIPLRGKDADAPLDLGNVLNAAYEHAGYDLSIDYREEPVPPLEAGDAAWADQLLRERGLR